MDVRNRIEIDRPRAEVAAFVEDPANDTRWIGGIAQVEMLTPPPFGRNTRVRRVARFMGKAIEYVLEVEAYEPGQLVQMRSVKGPFPMQVTYRFEDAGPTRTALEVRNQGDAAGLFRLAAPLMAGMVGKNVQADLARLKGALEGG